jgi:hypothetical protein
MEARVYASFPWHSLRRFSRFGASPFAWPSRQPFVSHTVVYSLPATDAAAVVAGPSEELEGME